MKDGVGLKWCVTELWVKNGVWQICVSTMVCVCAKVGHDKVHVAKVCVKDGVCDKDVTEAV